MVTFKYNGLHIKCKEEGKTMTNKRYDLNKQLAQMLKGGVIMDVTTPEQLELQKKPGLVLLWHLKEFLLIFVLLGV